MAPAVGLAHAATALALLALGLNVETRLRAGCLLAAQHSDCGSAALCTKRLAFLVAFRGLYPQRFQPLLCATDSCLDTPAPVTPWLLREPPPAAS
eukprot:COSAG04_NODE_2694_length_3723_cov_2.129415_1_plen_94_part_10